MKKLLNMTNSVGRFASAIAVFLAIVVLYGDLLEAAVHTKGGCDLGRKFEFFSLLSGERCWL